MQSMVQLRFTAAAAWRSPHARPGTDEVSGAGRAGGRLVRRSLEDPRDVLFHRAAEHRLAEAHECDFDFKASGKKLLAKQNPTIAPSKMETF